MENVVSGYDDSENEVLDIEVREETSAEEMQIRNGDDPPDILTADEAEKVLLSGDSGESYLTVVTTEEQTRQEPVEFIQEYKPRPICMWASRRSNRKVMKADAK